MSGWAQRAAERAEDEARDVSADEGIDWRGRALAAEALLGAAARGELPRCDDCRALATVHLPHGGEHLCDACFDAPNQDCDISAWPDLPHAAALRAAMGGAK